MSNLRIGIDFGGTGIKIALVSKTGELLKFNEFPTPKNPEPLIITQQIKNSIESLLDRTSATQIRQIPIGVGVAGDIDHATGVVRYSPNLSWKNIPLKRLLTQRLKQKIFIDNDANAAAWAAYIVDAKRKVSNLIAITLGTGVGGGVIINKSIYRGSTNSAGELGHMTFVPNGLLCLCGNHGCVERYIGAKAMVDEVKDRLSKGQKTLISKMISGAVDKLSPVLILEAAKRNDRFALGIWRSMGERLGIAMSSLVNLLNPDLIVLSGGLSRAGKNLLIPAKRTLKANSFLTPAKHVQLKVSKLDKHLGVVGAALLVP